jgi:hypothetical protein
MTGLMVRRNINVALQYHKLVISGIFGQIARIEGKFGHNDPPYQWPFQRFQA